MTAKKQFARCKDCENPFKKEYSHQVYCSPRCAFFSRVYVPDDCVNECWTWTGSKQSFGYGDFRYQGRLIRAHRFSFELCVGEIPAGMEILHDCDNPSCVNPNHLMAGTHAENILDMSMKGRHGGAKLIPEDIPSIRRRIAAGESNTSIARDYGVTRELISLIKHNNIWTHVEG